MKKICIIIFWFLVVSFISGCNQRLNNSDQSVQEHISYSQEYRIKPLWWFSDRVYGTVIVDNVLTVSSSIAGMIDMLACQPWMQVWPQSVIALIKPSDDVATQNILLQKQSLQNQISNLVLVSQSTTQSFDIQKAAAEEQLVVLKKNLENLERQKELSRGDLWLQVQSINDQLNALLESQRIDLDRIQTTLFNTRRTIYNTLTQNFLLFDQMFGVTNKDKNINFDIFISAKDRTVRNRAEAKFVELRQQVDRVLSGMDDNELSVYLFDTAEMFKTAANAVSLSIVTTLFPQNSTNPTQPSIDWLYNTFSSISNGLLGSKTNFDSLVSSYNATRNSYQNQINTLRINLQNLSGNRQEISDINLDTNVNSLRSQITNLEATIRNLDNQKNIQLTQLFNQSIGLQQNLNVIENSLAGEVVRAGISWIIKQKLSQEKTKVWPNTPICQITPTDKKITKVQIFSPQRIPLNTNIEMYQWDKYLATGSIMYELPYADPSTQNFIYEVVTSAITWLNEGQRLNILILQDRFAEEIWIPVNYVTPRLDWYFVMKKKNDIVEEVRIDVGPINNASIKVLSWLSIWDTLVVK